MLIAGFCLPLVRHSLLFGESFLVWPWHIAGWYGDVGRAAALGTAADREYETLWALLPLVLGIVVLGLLRLGDVRERAGLLAGLGLCALVLLLMVFVGEAQVLGVVFTPPSSGGGAIVLVGIAAATLVVSANHAARSAPDALLPRWIAAISGFVLGAIILVFALASQGSWSAWSMWLLYALLGTLAVFGLLRGFNQEPDEDSLSRVGLLARVALVWGVPAMIIAQSSAGDDYVSYVLQGGGGVLPIVLGVLKAALIYGGSALVMAVGLAMLMQRHAPPAREAA